MTTKQPPIGLSHKPYKASSAPASLNQAQKRLTTKHERYFSKLVHNPSVEVISDTIGAIFARPSGLLWGGIFSLIGSVGFFIVCRFYGYEYNYLVSLACLGGGFLLGLAIELIYAVVRKARRI